MTKKTVSSALVFLCIVLLSLFAVVKGFSYGPSAHSLSSGTVLDLSGQWQVGVVTDTYQEYTYTIPQSVTGSNVLSLQLDWTNAQLFLDGHILSSHVSSNTLGGIIRWWITLPQDPGGRVLSLRLSPGENPQRVLSGSTYLGENGAVLTQILQDSLYALIFGVFAALLAASILVAHISFCFSDVVRLRPDRSPVYLAFFILLAGLWVIGSSQLPLLFTGRAAAVAIVSFLSFHGMPVLLLLYVQGLLTKPSKLLRALWLIQCAELVGVLLWNLLANGPLYQVRRVAHVLFVLSVAALILVCIRDWKKNENRGVRGVLIAFPFLGGFALLSLVISYLSSSADLIYLYSLGIILFVFLLACSAGKQLHHHVKRSVNAEVYRKLAYTDPLTGLLSRTAYEEHLSQESLTVQDEIYVVFDLDDLKQINDTFGHQAGDKAIAGAARAIQKGFCPLGNCFRVGGDEFLAILPQATEAQVHLAAQVMEDELDRLSEGSPFPIRVAMGWSSSAQQGARGLSLFHQADTQMYLQKHRNKEASLG